MRLRGSIIALFVLSSTVACMPKEGELPVTGSNANDPQISRRIEYRCLTLSPSNMLMPATGPMVVFTSENACQKRGWRGQDIWEIRYDPRNGKTIHETRTKRDEFLLSLKFG